MTDDLGRDLSVRCPRDMHRTHTRRGTHLCKIRTEHKKRRGTQIRRIGWGSASHQSPLEVCKKNYGIDEHTGRKATKLGPWLNTKYTERSGQIRSPFQDQDRLGQTYIPLIEYDLHDLDNVCLVGSVWSGSCTTYHNGKQMMIVIRTHDVTKNPYIHLLFYTIVGPDYYVRNRWSTWSVQCVQGIYDMSRTCTYVWALGVGQINRMGWGRASDQSPLDVCKKLSQCGRTNKSGGQQNANRD